MTRRSPWPLLALCLLAACGSRHDRIESALRKGALDVESAQWDKASVEARNVLQMDPHDVRGIALGAAVAEGRGDLGRAFDAWTSAAAIAPADPGPRRALARIQLLGGDLDGAGRSLDALLQADPADAIARTLQAALMARLGRIAPAIAQLRAVIAAGTPAPTDASLALAGLLMQDGQAPQAWRVIETALKSEPNDVQLLRAGADVAEVVPGGADTAVMYFRHATTRAPGNDALWRQWAAFHERRHEIDQAEAVLRAALAAIPRDESRTLALLDFLQRARGAQATQQAAREAIAARPDAVALVLRLAALQDADGRGADAERTLQDWIAAHAAAPSANVVRDRLAARDLAAGNAPAADAWLAQALAANPRDLAALAMRGRLALANGHPADAVVDLRTAVRERPDADVVALLAQAYYASGQPRLARDALGDAVRFSPDDMALRLLLAADMAEQGEPAAADDALADAIRQSPQDGRPYELRARLALRRGDLVAAEAVWHARLGRAPTDAGALLNLAGIRQRRGDTAGANAVFDTAEQRFPDALPIRVAHAEWLARVGRAQAAITLYDRLQAEAPDDAVIANNLAWLLAENRHDPASLARALALAQRFEGSTDAGQLDTLGWVRLCAGRTAEAVATLRRAAALAPASASIQRHLGLALHESAGAG